MTPEGPSTLTLLPKVYDSLKILCKNLMSNPSTS